VARAERQCSKPEDKAPKTQSERFAFIGYSNVTLLAEVPRRCGGKPARELLMEVATLRRSVQLLGVTSSTSPVNDDPVKLTRPQHFDYRSRVLLPDIILLQ
jgi:hypothetical protein